MNCISISWTSCLMSGKCNQSHLNQTRISFKRYEKEVIFVTQPFNLQDLRDFITVRFHSNVLLFKFNDLTFEFQNSCLFSCFKSLHEPDRQRWKITMMGFHCWYQQISFICDPKITFRFGGKNQHQQQTTMTVKESDLEE